MKSFYSKLKVCFRKPHACERSNSIWFSCFLTALLKLWKVIFSVTYINREYSYMKSVTNCKCDIRRHRKCEVTNLLPKWPKNSVVIGIFFQCCIIVAVFAEEVLFNNFSRELAWTLTKLKEDNKPSSFQLHVCLSMYDLLMDTKR